MPLFSNGLILFTRPFFWCHRTFPGHLLIYEPPYVPIIFKVLRLREEALILERIRDVDTKPSIGISEDVSTNLSLHISIPSHSIVTAFSIVLDISTFRMLTIYYALGILSHI